MNTCLCGNAVEQEGALCERCGALQILGLNSDATSKQIESAYRMLVKVWHPDRFQNDAKLRDAAEEKLKSINAAHAYLASVPEAKPRRRTVKKAAPQETAMRPAIRTRRRAWLDATLASSILLRCLIVVAGLAVPLILLLGSDSWLASNPSTAGFYLPYRTRALFELRTNGNRVKQSLQRVLPAGSPVSPAPLPENATAHAPPPATESQPAVPVPHVPMPYVTAGFTQSEVETVMGQPVSASREALRYRNAVFYLHNGKVAGWKVDPSLIPLRVKLWPSGPLDPRLVSFTVGSSKNEVIAVQGTPTMLTENKLGYGTSEVFLESGRVIGWNDSHSSERLHVAAH
jgi:hypothetical protein